MRSTLQLFAGVILVAIVRGTPPGFAFLLALGGIAAGLGLGYARWRRTSYWLQDGALHFRAGLFTPDEKIVPRARVQSVDTATGPLQRLFGVVEVRVQVAGAADEDEIVLAAVTHEEAARLRLALGQPAPAPPDERVVLGMRGLLLAALTGPQISVAVSAVAGVYALLHNVVDVQQDGEGLLSQLDSPGEIALAAAALLGAAYVLAFLAAIVVFAGFEVQREAQVLRIRSGLLARRAISIPLARVDGVVIVEGLARGPLGLAALRLESAAHGGEQAAGRTLLPLVRRSEAEAVIARLVPALTLAPGELERPPRRALRRFVLPAAAGGAIAGAAPALVLTAAAWPAAPAARARGSDRGPARAPRLRHPAGGRRRRRARGAPRAAHAARAPPAPAGALPAPHPAAGARRARRPARHRRLGRAGPRATPRARDGRRGLRRAAATGTAAAGAGAGADRLTPAA